MGLEQKILGGTQALGSHEKMSQDSLFHGAANPDSCRRFRGLPIASNQRRNRDATCNIASNAVRSAITRRYSAAATRDGFLFAADNMKSEMRGTISDLKREPLKTP